MVKVIITAPFSGYARGEVLEVEPSIADAWVNYRGVALFVDEARAILAKLDELEDRNLPAPTKAR